MSRCCSRIARSHRRSALAVTLVVATATLTAVLYRPPAASAAQEPPADVVRSTCGGCHTLAAAGASGTVGPSLDESTKSVEEIVDLITNGPEFGGSMPTYKDKLPAAEIERIAEYIVEVRGKAKTPPPEPAATAVAAASPGTLTLTVAPRPQHPTELTLVARLDGSPTREGEPIAFSVVSTQFTQPVDVPIGTGRTAADGTASITYAPTWSGAQRFRAEVAGTEIRAAAAYRVAASAPGPLFANANPGRPLASVGTVFLDVILGLVAFVWLSLIVILVLAIVRMPRLAGGQVE